MWSLGRWHVVTYVPEREICLHKGQEAHRVPLVAQMVKKKKKKKSSCNAGDLGSIPGLGRFPGGGHGNPLQFSCMENPQGQRSLVGWSPWALQRVGHNWATKHSTHSSGTELEKVSYHSNPKEKQSHRMVKLSYNRTHFTCSGLPSWLSW